MADYYQNPQAQGQQQRPQNGQYTPRPTVTTSMYTIWDNAGVQLRVACLDSGLSVGLWVPEVSLEGTKKYPPDKRYNVVLSARNVAALDDIIFNKLLPAYTQGKDASFGIFTNSARTNLLEVTCQQGDFFVYLHRNCDPTTHVAQSFQVFKFEKVNVITSYDRTNGGVTAEPVQADFFIFARSIRAFNDLVSGTISAHGNRMTGDFRNRQLMDYVRAIATSVHAQLPAPSYQQRSGYQQNQYGAQNFNVDNPAQAPMLPHTETTEVDTLTDLIS